MNSHDEVAIQMRSLNELRSHVAKFPDEHMNPSIVLRSPTIEFSKEHEPKGLNPLVAKYILDEAPEIVFLLFDCSGAHCLCVDEDSFRKLTMLIATMPRGVRLRFSMDRIYLIALRKFPEVAKEFADFYSRPGVTTFEEWREYERTHL